ncbi:unnamed protein product, partial [marine sediment metagenome]
MSSENLTLINWIRDNQEELVKLIQDSGIEGKLLTTKEEYLKLIKNKPPSTINIKVLCGIKGHKHWITRPNNLHEGHWCPQCANESFIKYTYDECKNLAKQIGKHVSGIPGSILTSKDTYLKLINNKSPSKIILEWKCGIKSHKPWRARVSAIQQGHWCPECSKGLYEEICRWYFEKIFKSEFPTTLIKNILPNYKGKMHFDGFAILNLDNSVIKLAFEYNGIQHYEFPNYLHKNTKK